MQNHEGFHDEDAMERPGWADAIKPGFAPGLVYTNSQVGFSLVYPPLPELADIKRALSVWRGT